jgi:hypothetical protein
MDDDGIFLMGANDDIYKRTKLVPRLALHYELFFQQFSFFLGLRHALFCVITVIITSSFPTSKYSLSIIYLSSLYNCVGSQSTVALFLSSYPLQSYIRTYLPQRMSFVRAVHLRVPSGGEFLLAVSFSLSCLVLVFHVVIVIVIK